VATHTRYHLEGAHLPVRTWDSRPIQVGGVAADWDAAPQVAQAGAELVWLTSDTLPDDIRATAHALGGKPLWLHLTEPTAHDDAFWQSLLRASAELHLTLFMARADALQDAADALAVAREALRTEHVPIGAVEFGLIAREALPDMLEPLPYAVVWQVEAWTQALAERLWEAQATARALGVRRAVVVPDADAETLAIALGLEPHTLIVPAEALPDAKTRLARLSVAECREWLLLRLRDWESPALQRQPEAWLSSRAS
jgi:hypothetical protein